MQILQDNDDKYAQGKDQVTYTIYEEELHKQTVKAIVTYCAARLKLYLLKCVCAFSP